MTVGALDGVGGPRAANAGLAADRAVRGLAALRKATREELLGVSWLPADGGRGGLRPPAHTDDRRWTRRPGRKGGPMSEYLVVTGMSGAGRSTAGGHARGPGLVRDRQHAVGPHLQGLRAGRRRPAREMKRVAFVVGRGGGGLDDVLPAVDALDGRPEPGPDPVPGRGRRRADQAVRGHPAPPPPGGPGGGRLDRRRAAAPERACGTGPTWSSTPASSTPTSSGPA